MFDVALGIASAVHMGVRDKGGKPYILHPLRVAMRLRTNDEELMSIAVLHDVVEDGTITLEQLSEKGFSDRVIAALDKLTHRKGIPYQTYIRQMYNNMDALLVKREDLRDNSDITRLKGVTEKDKARMVKYHNAFLQIEEFIQRYKY